MLSATVDFARRVTRGAFDQATSSDGIWLVSPPGDLDETRVSSLIPTCSIHYTKEWRHPRNRKYITYRTAVRGKTEPLSRVICTENFVNFSLVVLEICERTDKDTDKQKSIQTDRQTCWLQYFAPLPGRWLTSVWRTWSASSTIYYWVIPLKIHQLWRRGTEGRA